jgi:hypothetical protein
MKTVNTQNSIQITEPQTQNTVGLDLNMSVYNELNDQTQSSVNVLELINNQFKQITEMNKRRSFILKEVSGYLVK